MSTSRKTPPKLAGRAKVDAQGNRTWAWNSDEVQTATVRALGEGLSLEDTAKPASLNPYDLGPAPAPKQPPKVQEATPTPKRRTLDDMRRLSEQIKRTKHWKRDP